MHGREQRTTRSCRDGVAPAARSRRRAFRLVLFAWLLARMPYEIAFTRPVTIANRDEYFNECCVGGDAVIEALMPAYSE